MNREILEQAGIDCEKCMKRMLNDEDLFVKILSMFPGDENFARAQKAYAERDYKRLLSAAHTIKGVSANCEMGELYQASAALVAVLKSGDFTAEQIDDKYAEFVKCHDKVCEGIKRALKE